MNVICECLFHDLMTTIHSAADCAEGRWGDGCRQQCKCAGSSLCDPMSGECFCPAGLKGRKCRRECPRGRYGVDCKQVCSAPTAAKNATVVCTRATERPEYACVHQAGRGQIVPCKIK
ncbi:Multiple epidermal growth factor-like domains protein 6 [Portunus trituberculatus]|uniref:Multiple epidermal growth factor-like domains protein 6 n=1 Tax=Portunus trituberculatus TaxID=210409 RepID=A0A5B7DSM9_PORTR|nr:Multiple epidermal growth factor-like domains protein 6 [Portunus trituberculatus]